MAALLLLSGLLIGREATHDFIFQTLPSSQLWYGKVGNYSLLSFGAAFGSNLLGWSLSILAFILLVQKSFWRKNPDDLFVKSMCFALILSPLSWLNYQVLLLPGLLILFQELPKASSRLRLRFS